MMCHISTERISKTPALLYVVYAHDKCRTHPQPMYTMLHFGSVLAVLIITAIVVLFRMIGGDGALSQGAGIIRMGLMLHFAGISRALLFFLGVVLVGGLTGIIVVPSLQAFRRTESWYGVLDPTLSILFLAQVAYSLMVCSVSELIRGGGAFLLGVGSSGCPGTLAVADQGHGTMQDEECSGSLSEQSSSSSHRGNGKRNGDGIGDSV